MDAAVAKIAAAVADAARTHEFGPEVPVVALGGAGMALAPEVARALGRPLVTAEHPEILSSIGAALSLVRAEIARHCSGPGATLALARDAQRACVDAGAAPQTVRVETHYEVRGGLLRAVATGAVALESGAASREAADAGAQLRAAASALRIDAGALHEIAVNDYYRVFGENGAGAVAVVDGTGSVALAERARRIVTAPAGELIGPLREALDDGVVNLGVATLLPRVVIVCGAHVVDLSEARAAEEIITGAEGALAGEDGPAVAVVWS